MTRALRLAGVAVLLHMSAPVPSAAAVAPPPVDHAYLPVPATPAPPGPTEQSARCSGTIAAKASVSGQLSALNLPAVWPLSRGAGQTVAVIDTGVARHRLLPHLVPGGDFVSASDGTLDCDGHGTAVAGIIGAATADGFSGVAPDATIMSIRQSSNKFRLRSDTATTGLGDVDTLARAIRSAADAGATVINVSSVACQPAAEPPDDRALGAALAYAVDVRNAVVVTAAGNVGGSCTVQNSFGTAGHPGVPDWDTIESVVSPAWYDDYVLTVGSVGTAGAPSDFSLAGPWVDVAAPGEHVVTLGLGFDGLTDSRNDAADRRPLAGTSYAAPVVSGVVALVRSRLPQLTARQVMARIRDTARHPPQGWNPRVGRGMVDALAAVSADSATVAASATSPSARVRPTPPARDTPAGRIAFAGSAICIALVLLGAGALRLRVRR